MTDLAKAVLQVALLAACLLLCLILSLIERREVPAASIARPAPRRRRRGFAAASRASAPETAGTGRRSYAS